MRIALATTDPEIRRSFAVVAELRPRLPTDDFVPRIRRLQQAGYHLAYLEDGGEVCAVAGFWLRENLAWGRHLYLDDLVTAATRRSTGWGGRLFDWVVEYARGQGCAELHLDSGVQRYGAHRFYLCRRMDITSHHFAMKLG